MTVHRVNYHVSYEQRDNIKGLYSANLHQNEKGKIHQNLALFTCIFLKIALI